MLDSTTWLLTILLFDGCVSLIPSLYGNDSGSFGEWHQDNNTGDNFYGLPYYRYTLDQVNDKTATIYNSSVIYQSNRAYNPETNITDHFFQFGNDRVTVISSNYGYVRVRMDETGSKFLNDFKRENNQYGAGIGYVTSSNGTQLLLSTFYQGNTNKDIITKRDYSFYYRRYYTQSTQKAISLTQTLISPFGTDPVIISKVSIANIGHQYSKVNYYEVWGGFFYPFIDGVHDDDRRKYQMENYKVTYSAIKNDNGLVIGISADYTFIGKPMNISGQPGGYLYDEQPPTTFIVLLSDTTQDSYIGIACDSGSFFGNGQVENPAFYMSDYQKCNANMSNSSLIIEWNNVPLSTTGYFMYGYIPHGSEYCIQELVSKYTKSYSTLQQNTAQSWYNSAIKFENENYPEISREILWNYGMMRSSLSFYNLFNEFIIDQGTFYKYGDNSGSEIAFRDPVFHSLPFILSNATLFKSIMRFSIKQIQPPFGSVDKPHNLPYGILGNGVITGTGFIQNSIPSDLEITLLYAITQYIEATKDIDFLFESIDLNIFMDPNNINGNHTHTILDCLLECYEYLSSGIGIGRHGVFRLQTMDLSDSFVELATEGIPGYNQQDIIDQGESGLNTPMLAYVLPRFYNILLSINISLPEMQQFAIQQQDVLKNVLWNGKWINRAWIPKDNTTDGQWLGSLEDGKMHSSPQSWTILSGVLNTTESMILLDNINKNLRQNKFGATNVNIPYNNPNAGNELNGTHANGGVWYSRNGPLILALSQLNASQAFDEWQRNSFAFRANMFPDFWPNIWTSSDVSTSELVNMEQHKAAIGTSNWPDFPVLCTHAYSWPLWTFSSGIVGIGFNGLHDIIIQPAMPKHVGSFQFNSSLVDVIRDDDNNYMIKYRPKRFIGNVLKVILDLSVVEDDIGNKDKWRLEKEIAVDDTTKSIQVYFQR